MEIKNAEIKYETDLGNIIMVHLEQRKFDRDVKARKSLEELDFVLKLYELEFYLKIPRVFYYLNNERFFFPKGLHFVHLQRLLVSKEGSKFSLWHSMAYSTACMTRTMVNKVSGSGPLAVRGRKNSSFCYKLLISANILACRSLNNAAILL